MTNIIVAHNSPILRKALKSLLEAEPEFCIIGEVSGGIETVRLSERLRPDVVVVDFEISGISSFEVTRQISKNLPKTNVIIISRYSNQGHVLKALRSGAKAYILTESPPEELTLAIREVTAGRHYLTPALSEWAMKTYIHSAQANTPNEYDKLTTREREVLHLVAEGFTNTEIAARLYISARTVEIHRINMMHKLNLKTPTQLIRYAYKQGILRMDS